MKIEFTRKYHIDELPFLVGKRAVALGMFDGIHEGHIDIIKSLVRYAAANNLISCVQTFTNLPKTEDGVLTTSDEQQEILSSLGVDEMLVLDYRDICDMGPYDFVVDYVTIKMGAAAVIVGSDYRFGKGASADAEKLRGLCKPMNIDVIIRDFKTRTGRKVSSTWLREDLDNGHPDEYAKLCLGRPFSYTGKVVKGKQMGRQMGFPTANIRIPEGKCRARRGVYLSRIILGHDTYYGVTNIGLRPTLEDATEDVCETYIFDFDEDIYGALIRVELLFFLRDETAFPGKDELISSVEADKKRARELLQSQIL